MRVANYYNNRDIRVEERPVPKIGPGELLIRVEASGICGSDVMEWYRIHKAPLILGHEIAGIIQEVGEGVTKYKPGQRVACAHHVPCGKCDYCLFGHETVCEQLRSTNFDPGGFAEYLRLPKINVESGVFPLPDEVSFDAATFVEPLACVLRGQKIAGFKQGAKVLVLGSGIAGLLHIHLARASGAGFIAATDIAEYRLAAARRFGADISINANDYSADKLRAFNKGRLADLVIVSTGAGEAVMQALGSVERGGTVLFFAPAGKDTLVSLAFNELFWRTEITLTSSYAATPDEYREALRLIASRRLKVSDMITHRLPLAETASGFRLVAEGRESIKVIIYPQK